MACSGVLAKIQKAKELFSQGKCWCECVKDDIPKAEALAAQGKCLGANSVITAALARCDESSPSLTITPIAPFLPESIL